MRTRQVLLWLLIAALCTPVCARVQGARRSLPQEQTTFGMEIKVRHPVSLPEDILQMLRGDEDVKTRCLGPVGPGQIRAAFFAASKIHLDDHKSPDYVVTAAKDNPCLGGANVDPFWVFYWTPQGYQLGLKVDTFSLHVRKTRTKAYRDIDTEAITGTELFSTLFHFDGSKYINVHSSRQPLPIRKGR